MKTYVFGYIVLFFMSLAVAASEVDDLLTYVKKAKNIEEFCRRDASVRKWRGYFCGKSKWIASYILAVCKNAENFETSKGFATSKCKDEAVKKLMGEIAAKQLAFFQNNYLRSLIAVRDSEDYKGHLCRLLKDSGFKMSPEVAEQCPSKKAPPSSFAFF